MRSPTENTAPNSDLVEEFDPSRQGSPKESSSQTSEDKGESAVLDENNSFHQQERSGINQQELSEQYETQQELSAEVKAGHEDCSFPNLTGGIENQSFNDRKTTEGVLNAKSYEQGGFQYASSGSNKRSLQNTETWLADSRKDDATQSQLFDDSTRPFNGQSIPNRNKSTSRESLNAQENPPQPEDEPKSSGDSLHDRKGKFNDISPSSRPTTDESTQISSSFSGFESFSDLRKLSLDDESLGITHTETRDSRATKKSGNNTVLNDLFADIVQSTEPSLRHLASQSTLSESSSIKITKTARRAKRMSTPVEEQRHPGKPGLWSDKFMKNIDELVEWDSAEPNTGSLISISNPETLAGPGNNDHFDSPREQQQLDVEHPGAIALTFLTIGLCLSVFLISLDRTIITTAIPYISGEFQSYADVGWYGSAYLLTACAFQPFYGKIFTSFSIKWSYLAANMTFEIGSLICGIAPNSLTLIIGRAIAGVGSAGILTGSFVVVAHSVPMHKRPVFTAAVGLMFGLGATVGPLLGGVFTDLVTWRWCFYFNLPVGGVTILAMIVFFNPKNNMITKISFGSRVLELDIIGNFLLLGACVMLFIAFQYTEEGSSWSSSKVIGLLVGFSVTIVVFGLWLWYQGDKALIPLDILKQRSVLASCLFSFFIYSALIIHSYYLPQWFQAIKNTSAITSGVDMIPYVVCNAFFSLVAGIVVSKSGYFTPPTIIGTAIATIGCGLISTLKTDTTSAQWIGYEILSAAGFGIAIQQGFTAVQTVLPLEKVPIGTAAVVASQSFGGAIFVSVGNTILQNQLKSSAKNGQLQGIDIQAVLDAGVTGIRSVVDADQLPAVLAAYNGALQKVFIAAIPVTALAFVSSLFLEWKSVKTKDSAERV
ncbi:hypothetical protein SS1G_13906 [Sclerotinia sclerotiorum 1980 UF-70]|uniref:Major facilitator superfamily (MFS) profile domain-containing protein n=2 Tax=Sclerotinia sclerotiorum (strain ATCC 18683 / 1980 / Ss-1) TaxID=665079 RepID=A7F8H5_SCLS1|nr:hypothetical protein SS1G_13906 [Sclerotinia sclerotiorum 1980 UF-70]APA13812.1 hypothetical protein sscle_11g085820 [Sclerotinia sclerotiorum 1980 UF-70]EDN99046.1 hypothetical protein SS1G_13906 [Sclerotinia sclerotiorum 1980 UF-70]